MRCWRLTAASGIAALGLLALLATAAGHRVLAQQPTPPATPAPTAAPAGTAPKDKAPPAAAKQAARGDDAPAAMPSGPRVAIATPYPFDTLDPHVMIDTRRALPRLNFYDALYRWQDSPVRLAPWLAQSYTLSEDGKIYRFTLRRGVRFHDNSEVKASDVVYSVERVLALKQGAGSLLTGLVNPGSTKAIDDYTVEFSLSRPSTLFLPLLPEVHIVNAALLKTHEVNNDWGKGWLARNEAGSGPYRLHALDSAGGFVATRFADHWNAGWGAKPVETVEVVAVLDGASRVEGLTRGRFQAVKGPLLPHELRQLKQVRDVSPHVEDVPRIFVGLLHHGREALKQPDLRRAIAQAFDYDAFVRASLATGAVRAPIPLPPTFGGANANGVIAVQTTDLAAAKASIAKLKAPVPPLTIGAIAGDPHSERAAVLMMDGLARLGIGARIISEPWPGVAARMRDEKTMFDILFLWKGARYLDPHNWVGEMYDCDQIGTGNSSWYCNKDVDALLKEARASTDPKARIALYEKAATMVAEDVGGLFVASAPTTAAHIKRLKGFSFTPTAATLELRGLSLEPRAAP